MPFEPGQSGNPGGKWKPGQSGNPLGRPKTKPFKDALQRILARGDNVEMDNAAAALIAKAGLGDVAAIKELADRLDGKVTQPIAGDDEGDAIRITAIERRIIDTANPDSSNISAAPSTE